MEKKILNEIKRIRNIEGTLVGTKLNGYKTEVPRGIVEDLLNHLKENEAEYLEVAEIVRTTFIEGLSNVLEVNGFEMILR